MFGVLLKLLGLVVGVFLVCYSVRLTLRYLKDLLERSFPELGNLIHPILVLALILLQAIGWALIIDAVVPGQAEIVVHGEELVRKDPYAHDLRVEVAVANFGGSLDPDATHYGRFDATGVSSFLIDFDWFRSRFRVRVFRGSDRLNHLVERWEYVSVWARIGLVKKKHVYVSDR